MPKTSQILSLTHQISSVFVLLLSALLLAACAAAQPTAAPKSLQPAAVTPTSLPSPTETPQPTSLPEATLDVAVDPSLGTILVGNDGLTLYIFTKDDPDQSNCDAKCLENWPPLLTQGSPILGAGIDDSKVGTATLSDGTLIVTFDHMPLYYFAKDTQPGDVKGQGVGSVWYVLDPDGHVFGMEPATGDSRGDTVSASSGQDDTGYDYGDYGDDSSSTPATEAAEAVLNVAVDPSLGTILVGNDGLTLYIFTKDEPDQSSCDSDCMKNWPPLLTQGSPILGAGIDDSKVGMAVLSDGTMIITYDHMPLYYFAKDTQPGDVKGQGVGSVWYVLDPDGHILGK